MKLKNRLLDSILAPCQLPSKITTLLRKKFYLLYYVFQNFKMIFSIKNFQLELIVKVLKKFYRKMFKILYPNRVLLDGRLF